MDAVQIPLFRLIVYRTTAARRRFAWHKLFLVVVVVLGAGLRLSLVAGQRFHSDEAIYGYWAQLIASGRDPLLLSVPLDKPPLFLYLLAAVFRLLGPGEVAARWIGQAASLITIVLTCHIGRRLYDWPVALLAAAAMALSPFNILFAPTAFTDPLMVALALAAMALVIDGRWGWGGLFAGLAVATKQQAVLFLPLIVALGWIAPRGRPRGANLIRLGLAFFGVMLILVGWDALRWQARASFWQQSAASHGPLHFVPWWEWGARLIDWWRLLGYFFASPLLNALLLLGLPLLLWHNLRRSRSVDARADWLLTAFGVVFFLLHWLLSFNPWDRYLLGLVPVASLLLARLLWRAWLRLGLRQSGLAVLLLLLLLAAPAGNTLRGDYPVGGNQGIYQGLEQVVAFFRQEAPAGAVVWHHYLGWHYYHYLFDAPLDLRWYADAQTLAIHASTTLAAANYLAFPAWEVTAEPATRAALASAELGLALERRIWRADGTPAFSIWRIVPLDSVMGETWRVRDR